MKADDVLEYFRTSVMVKRNMAEKMADHHKELSGGKEDLNSSRVEGKRAAYDDVLDMVSYLEDDMPTRVEVKPPEPEPAPENV